ncbi:MAG: SDR family oxidoreductase [Myxococcales bacterium]|nr:SDR family oxidoreductase [Myxococcales bacterium]
MSDRQVALVTGASSGFGLLTSVELARRGLRVFASMRDLGRRERLDRAAAEAKVELEFVALEVTSVASVAAAVGEVTAKAGRIDVLVNNAGFGIGGFLEDLTLGEVREQFETNFFGALALTKAVVAGMRERRRGRIIQVSSIAGRVAIPGMSAYCASKFALEGLSEALRYELAPYGVQVVLVEPGTFRTDIFDRNRRMAARATDETSPYFAVTRRMEQMVDKMVAKSTADPADVAEVIADAATVEHPRLRYLVGDDARRQAFLKSLLPASLWEKAVLKFVGHRG